MIKINVRPLSVNEAWKGRRFKTDAYKAFEWMVIPSLPKLSLPEPPYTLNLVFGFSNIAADLDNPAKVFIDCLCKKYGFNDKHIFELNIKKQVVPKGKEFISFNISNKLQNHVL